MMAGRGVVVIPTPLEETEGHGLLQVHRPAGACGVARSKDGGPHRRLRVPRRSTRIAGVVGRHQVALDSCQLRDRRVGGGGDQATSVGRLDDLDQLISRRGFGLTGDGRKILRVLVLNVEEDVVVLAVLERVGDVLKAGLETGHVDRSQRVHRERHVDDQPPGTGGIEHGLELVHPVRPQHAVTVEDGVGRRRRTPARVVRPGREDADAVHTDRLEVPEVTVDGRLRRAQPVEVRHEHEELLRAVHRKLPRRRDRDGLRGPLHRPGYRDQRDQRDQT